MFNFIRNNKMNLSTVSSLLFTLSLILISHAPLPTSSASLFESICNEAGNDKARCLQLLKVEPQIGTTTDYVKLSKLILEIGLKKATQGQNHIKGIMKKRPSSALNQCGTTLYDGVVGSFRSSLGELGVDGLTANYDAKVAGDGPVTCDRAMAAGKVVDPSITALNREIQLISKIAYIVTNKLPDR